MISSRAKSLYDTESLLLVKVFYVIFVRDLELVKWDPTLTAQGYRHTVRITLREPSAPFLNHLANPAACAILAREAEEKFGDFNDPDAVIGTGPFVDVWGCGGRTDRRA